MGAYNLDFVIAAFVLYMLAGYFYFKQRHIERGRHIIFTALYLSAVGTLLLDIAGSLTIDLEMDSAIVVVTNTLYYVAKQGTVFFFLFFVMSHLEMKSQIHPTKKLLLILPASIMLCFILTNPFTGYLFTYTQQEDGSFAYHSNWARNVQYGITLFYYIWSCIYVIRERKVYEQSLRMQVYFISAINIGALVFQRVQSSVLVLDFVLAVSMLVIVMTEMQKDSIIDRKTGLATKTYLDHCVKKMMHNHFPFSSIMVRLGDYDLLTTSYGVTNAEDFVIATGRYLSGVVSLGNAFKVSNSCFVLNVDRTTDLPSLEKKILEELNNSRVINQVEMTGTFFVTHISYPEKVEDIESYNAYLTYFQKMKKMRYGVIAMDELQIRNKVRESKIEAAIEHGLERNTFEVYYQPICTSVEQKFVTAEALVRLTDPELGPVSPADFIPIAESNGTIIQIGRIVLEEVCKFLSTNNIKKLGLEYIELNLSAVQCLQRDFISFIDEVTKRYHVPTKMICFEITETASNCAPAIFTDNLRMLRERGYRLALDDFGTGYGNLQRMVTSDFDIIKFDRGMTMQICSEKRLVSMFRTMRSMFHSMGSVVVAEGVETEEQYEIMKSAGCDYIQGYYFSRPLPERDFLSFLEMHLQIDAK